RNILLYTLFEDDVPANHIWDIFYHFKLTEHAFGLVVTQSRKLIELSTSPEAWHQSQYGSFLKLVTGSTLEDLRKYWSFYADFPELPPDRAAKLQSEFNILSKRMSGRAKNQLNMGASRSAANAWREAANPVNDQFAHYWEHGTTATANKEIKKTVKLNPTFCYSTLGETFDILTNTFPQGYHFVSAFTPLLVDPVGPPTDSAMAKAKQQFKAGLSALRASRQANAITLRFFIGDALAFCRALSAYAETKETQPQEFVAPWRATPIDLSEHATSSPPPPNTFDVIDSSTLGSELGLFNILLAGQPLLKPSPASQAIIYTELSMQPGFAVDTFEEHLCGRVSNIGILLGLAPRSYISLFTSISNTHELMKDPDGQTLYIERIAWTNPTGGDKAACDNPDQTIGFAVHDLAHLLFSVYCWMLACDSVTDAKIRTASPGHVRILSSTHYTRETFAILVTNAWKRFPIVDDDWKAVADVLLGLSAVHSSKLSIINYFNELQSQFRLRGIGFKNFDSDFEVDMTRTEAFRDWKTPPPRLVCVVLTVPSHHLDVLRRDRMTPGPRLVCNISTHSNPIMRITYESIQACWGECVPLDSDERYKIRESPSGFRGQSDLVVSFWADAEMLAPPETVVTLAIRVTPFAASQYRNKLQGPLTLYSAPVTDKAHVLILKERPTGASYTHTGAPALARPISPPDSIPTCEVYVSQSGATSFVESMVAKIPVDSPPQKGKSSKGAKISTTQIGPCTLQVTVGNSKYVARYPYPIRGAGASAEINHESHEVNIKVDFFSPVELGGYPSDLFPIVQRTNFSPWNIHHVRLDCFPKIDVKEREKLSWLIMHTTLQMSDRERLIQRSKHPTKRSSLDALVNVKESLLVLMLDYAGLRQGPHASFGLVDTMHGYFVMIFVAGMHLDLAGGTVVLYLMKWSRLCKSGLAPPK
ncbi:hypothetical protein FRC11_006884, partial [Ceratobasidium sp. 423]